MTPKEEKPERDWLSEKILRLRKEYEEKYGAVDVSGYVPGAHDNMIIDNPGETVDFMMDHRFDSVEKAEEAGYNPALKRRLEMYRGYHIEEVDTSGHKSFGYRFAVQARPCGAIAERGILGPWGTTVTVYTNDKNKLGHPGSFRPMFAPGELVRAIRQAEAAVRAAWQDDPGCAMVQPTADPGLIGSDCSDETGTDMVGGE